MRILILSAIATLLTASGPGIRTARAVTIPAGPVAATAMVLDDDWEDRLEDWEDYQEDRREAWEEYQEDVREARKDAYKRALKARRKALRHHGHHRQYYAPAPVYVPAPAPYVAPPVYQGYAPGYYGYPYGGGVHLRFGPWSGMDVRW